MHSLQSWQALYALQQINGRPDRSCKQGSSPTAYCHITGAEIYGVLAPVLGTAIAVITWVAITHSYRNEKRILIAEIGNRLKASDTTDAPDTVQPSEEMRNVAREIAKWCLWRWDGFLGFRAGSDSVGRRAGVWKDKFDSVRGAVLLAAMASLNRTLCDNVA